MASSSENSGISISGGNFSGTNVAIGAHSTITQSAPTGQVERALADLGGTIDAFQGSPATRDALKATHLEIAQELAAPSPDKGRLMTKLGSLKELAMPAATIVEAGAALAHAITSSL